MPAPRDLARRALADRDFRFFCEACFPDLFTLAWSNDRRRAVDPAAGDEQQAGVRAELREILNRLEQC